jgi:hypothetical protein
MDSAVGDERWTRAAVACVGSQLEAASTPRLQPRPGSGTLARRAAQQLRRWGAGEQGQTLDGGTLRERNDDPGFQEAKGQVGSAKLFEAC